MKSLLPRILWDYLVGAIVAASAIVVVLILVGFVAQAASGTSETGQMLRGGLVHIGFVTLVGVFLTVTLYEIVMRLQARGKMVEPGTTESRILSRDIMIRALISGAVAGVYIALVAIIFSLLADSAQNLTLFWVFVLGILPAVMLVAAGALAYAYVGPTVQKSQVELNDQERFTLLILPLVLAVTFGFIFGAASGSTEGVINAFAAALLTYVLIRGLELLRWRVIIRSLGALLHARGGPTIKVVATHSA